MPKKTSRKRKSEKPKRKHRFFLNPYRDRAFTKCPACEGKTREQEFALVIHIKPKQFFLLNLRCRHCPDCDLIIAKKDKVESSMAAGLQRTKPEIVGNEYLVMGTLDRQDQLEGNRGGLPLEALMDRMLLFRDVWHFDEILAGWSPSREK